jgi:hypothetical protein
MTGRSKTVPRRTKPRPKWSDVAPPRVYRLVPELVPKPLWGISASKTLRFAWKKIRQDVLAAANQKCELCDHEPNPYYGDPLNCHEVWHYDDRHAVATLIQLRAQCNDCDSAVHIGRAIVHGAGDKAFAQLQKVNSISYAEAERLYDAALAQWKSRSKVAWQMRVAEPLVARYPALARLAIPSGHD